MYKIKLVTIKTWARNGVEVFYYNWYLVRMKGFRILTMLFIDSL